MDRIDLTDQGRSLRELVTEATGEVSTLLRKEVELAKAELREEIVHTGKGIGAFGAAGLTAYLAVIFVSLAMMFGLAAGGLPLGAAALLVGLLYAAVAAVLAIAGKRELDARTGLPRTAETLKEDVEWARHPNG